MAPKRFSDDDLARVRERANIVALVEQHGTDLRQSGTSHKGLCPFHDERTPSFSVRAAEGTFHCFGCGVAGDAIEFVQRTQMLGFPDAVRHLAATVGITLGEEADPEADQERLRKQHAREALAVANSWFQQQLHTPAAVSAREQLTSRGFSRDAAATFECGYAPRDPQALHRHLVGAGVSNAAAESAGLIGRDQGRTWTRFRDRLVFPIKDHTGQIAGFGARALDPTTTPKYLNSPEGPLFHKSRLLYGWSTARAEIVKSGRVVIVEGYTDVMAAHLSGVGEVVASCGTSFSADHLTMVLRTVPAATQIVFCFDNDAAGLKAAHAAWVAAKEHATRLHTVPLPNGGDPCDLYQAHGPTAVQEALAHQQPLTRWLLDQAAAAAAPTPEGKADAAAAMRQLVTQIPDPVLRDSYRHLLTERWGIPADVDHPASRAAQPPPSSPGGWTRHERRIARRLITDPCGIWPTLTHSTSPDLADPAAAAVLSAARAAATHADPLQSHPRAWAGAVTDAAAEQDITRAALATVLGVDDPDETPTEDLVEVWWRRSDENTRRAQLDDIARQLETATGDDAEQLWRRFTELNRRL